MKKADQALMKLANEAVAEGKTVAGVIRGSSDAAVIEGIGWEGEQSLFAISSGTHVVYTRPEDLIAVAVTLKPQG